MFTITDRKPKDEYVNENGFKSSRVVSMDTVTIPAKHEMVVRSRLTRTTNSHVGVLVPEKVFIHSHGLALANVLVDTSHKSLYTRLFNTGDEPVTVKKETNMAVFEPVKDIGRTISDVDNIAEHDDMLPEYLVEMYERGCTNLNSEERAQFRQFLIKHQTTFADPKGKMRRITLGEHTIKLKDPVPFKEAPRRVPIYKRKILDEEIAKLEQQGLIERSESPWSSQLVLAKSGTIPGECVWITGDLMRKLLRMPTPLVVLTTIWTR
ncbi:uncharacterized protein LOC117338637 [Pecten maximus]|uniref:uncharacterized protein LOC117338637 n=1 Tax=Pecten maximus TaxID=6579 RepID=UPI001458DF3A|nr:uncharacterized protein LOC117338637 [Pecten maximus]